MGRPMDYDDYAYDYVWTRSAVPWILAPLVREVGALVPRATVIEIGCGTGDYIIALAEMFPRHCYEGFDLSTEMLKLASRRSGRVRFVRADADAGFPYGDEEADVAFMVDVVHHLRNLSNLFLETFRTLKPHGLFVIVTDSEANIRARSLTHYFPEILDVEIDRYPRVADLARFAEEAGFRCEPPEPAEGYLELDDEFVSRVERKCSSAMRLISDEAHRTGVRRVREARKHGEKWFSCYTVLKYRKP